VQRPGLGEIQQEECGCGFDFLYILPHPVDLPKKASLEALLLRLAIAHEHVPVREVVTIQRVTFILAIVFFKYSYIVSWWLFRLGFFIV